MGAYKFDGVLYRKFERYFRKNYNLIIEKIIMFGNKGVLMPNFLRVSAMYRQNKIISIRSQRVITDKRLRGPRHMQN